MVLRVGENAEVVVAKADVVVVENSRHARAEGVQLETDLNGGFVASAPRAQLDDQGKILVLEGGVRVDGGGLGMESRQVRVRYDNSNRLVGVDAAGAVRVTRSSWVATGETATLRFASGMIELRGSVLLMNGQDTRQGGLVRIGLGEGEPQCEGCSPKSDAEMP